MIYHVLGQPPSLMFINIAVDSIGLFGFTWSAGLQGHSLQAAALPALFSLNIIVLPVAGCI